MTLQQKLGKDKSWLEEMSDDNVYTLQNWL